MVIIYNTSVQEMLLFTTLWVSVQESVTIYKTLYGSVKVNRNKRKLVVKEKFSN